MRTTLSGGQNIPKTATGDHLGQRLQFWLVAQCKILAAAAAVRTGLQEVIDGIFRETDDRQDGLF